MKKITYILLSCVCFCMFFWAPVCRVEAASGTVKNPILNVRKDASTSSSIVCKLSKGTSVQIGSEKTGTDGMKWYSVSFTYNGSSKKGYVRADLVNVTNTASTTASAQTSDYYKIYGSSVNVRERATTGSSKVATLQNGIEVKHVSSEQGTDGYTWRKVSFTYNNEAKSGYIRSDLLMASSGSAFQTPVTTTSTVTTPTVSTGVDGAKAGDILSVNASAVRVREHAGDTYKIVANLLKGDKVEFMKERLGDDGKKWTKIKCTINENRYHGYIRSDYLTRSYIDSSDDGTEYRYVNVSSGVRVRKSADSSSTVIANLLRGDRGEFKKEKTGADGRKWTKIKFFINGTRYDGYVHSDDLSKSAL